MWLAWRALCAETRAFEPGGGNEPLELPFWRQCCGWGVDLTNRRMLRTEPGLRRQLWSLARTLEEAWNLLTHKLV